MIAILAVLVIAQPRIIPIDLVRTPTISISAFNVKSLIERAIANADHAIVEMEKCEDEKKDVEDLRTKCVADNEQLRRDLVASPAPASTKAPDGGGTVDGWLWPLVGAGIVAATTAFALCVWPYKCGPRGSDNE